jgi:hypothetical protein
VPRWLEKIFENFFEKNFPTPFLCARVVVFFLFSMTRRRRRSPFGSHRFFFFSLFFCAPRRPTRTRTRRKHVFKKKVSWHKIRSARLISSEAAQEEEEEEEKEVAAAEEEDVLMAGLGMQSRRHREQEVARPRRLHYHSTCSRLDTRA